MLEKYQKIYELYLSDPFIKIDDACEKFNVCRSSFYRALKKEGLEYPKKYSTTCSKDKMETAVNLYNNGLSIKSISIKLNMGEKTLSKYLHNNEIQIRDAKERRDDLIYDRSFFFSIDTEEKAYWLGFIFADGSIYNTGKSYRLTIELSTVDKKHLEKFIKSIHSNLDIAYRKNRPTCCVHVCSKELVEDLQSYGAIQNKTENGWIENRKISQDLYKHFLRGYIDGDGYIDKTRYRIVITVKSLKICSSLKEMLSTLDLKYKIKEDQQYYRLYVEDKQNFINSIETLYSNSKIFLDRKKQLCDLRLAHLGGNAKDNKTELSGETVKSN